MSKQFTLGKNERLKSRKLIEQLFKEGKTFTAAPFKVFYFKTPLIPQPLTFTLQFGVGVSSRHFKKAVDRNRIKRLTREAYRLQKTELQEQAKKNRLSVNLFFIYTGKDMPDYKLVSAKVNVILNKLLKIVNENTTSAS